MRLQGQSTKDLRIKQAKAAAKSRGAVVKALLDEPQKQLQTTPHTDINS